MGNKLPSNYENQYVDSPKIRLGDPTPPCTERGKRNILIIFLHKENALGEKEKHMREGEDMCRFRFFKIYFNYGLLTLQLSF